MGIVGRQIGNDAKPPSSAIQIEDGGGQLWATGGCRRQVDGKAGLPSAPENAVWPRQLRLVPLPDLRHQRGGDSQKHSRLRVERLEQRLRFFKILSIKTFGKPAVDRGEKIAGFDLAALVGAEPGEAHSGAQFPKLGALLFGDPPGVAILLRTGLGLPLPLQQIAFLRVQFRLEPALPCPFDDLQGIVQQGQSLFNLPCNLTCSGQEAEMKGSPRGRPGSAVSSRTAAQQKYALGQVARIDLDPAAVNRSQRTPVGET